MNFVEKPGSRSFVPCGEDGIPELWEGEVVNFELSGCEIAFSAAAGPLGKGKLYITSKRVLWIGENVDSAFDYDVPFIALHAVSRDVDSYPKPCIYCQLDVEEEDEEDEDVNTEVFFAPSDESDLMKMFDALSHAALLNPDPEVDGEEFLGDFIYDADEIAEGSEQARILNHLDSVFVEPGDEEEEGEDGQYDDAEEQREEPEKEGDKQPEE